MLVVAAVVVVVAAALLVGHVDPLVLVVAVRVVP